MNIVSRIPTDRDSSLVMAKVYEEPRKIPYWEQALISLWFLNSFIPLPLETPLRYLLVLWFLWLFALHKEQVIPIVLKAWPLFLLPVFGLISVLWSPYMGAAVRSGALYLLTPLVAVIIITRYDISTILR